MEIYKYQNVTYISGQDKLLGSQNNVARNFTLDMVSSHISSIVRADISANPVNVVGSVDYSKIKNVPTASMSTSGILSLVDYTRLMNHINKPRKLNLITSATTTIVQNEDDLQTLEHEFNYLYLYCDGPSSGNYSAEVSFYTYEGGSLVLMAKTTLTENNNRDYVQIFTENKEWCASVSIVGIVSGINVKVML